MLENGVDVRFIQRLLGHAKLDTTRLYTHVASIKAERVRSPLDHVLARDTTQPAPAPQPQAAAPRPVGRMRLELTRNGDRAEAAIVVTSVVPAVRLEGIVVKEARPGWVCIDLPPLERWRAALARLPADQRQRFEEPDLYERLRGELGARFLAAARPAEEPDGGNLPCGEAAQTQGLVDTRAAPPLSPGRARSRDHGPGR